MEKREKMKKSNRKKAATESGVEESETGRTAATESTGISEETAAVDGAVIGVNAQTAVADEKTLSKSEKRKRVALNWILMAVGIIMMSASVYFFQTPNDLTLGGIAGNSHAGRYYGYNKRSVARSGAYNFRQTMHG